MKRTTARKKNAAVDWVRLVGWVALCELTGLLASSVTVPAIPVWYAGLIKPPFAPPSWLFGPVWTVLYALMGIAAYRVSRTTRAVPQARIFMAFFWMQLIFNFVWSYIFFGSYNIIGGFVDIAALWIVLLIMVAALRRADRTARYLLLPYLLWVSYAMVLNYSLWLLNA